jgi:hypothetical protein
MKGLLHFSVDTAACLKQENKIGVKWRGRPNSSSSVENEIKKRAQILLHFQLKMLQEMTLLKRELITGSPIAVEFPKIITIKYRLHVWLTPLMEVSLTYTESKNQVLFI